MLSKIFLFALFTSMVVADLDAEENGNQPELLYGQQAARFMAFRVTRTTVKFETKTEVVETKSLCAALAAGVTACRRRKRGIDEKPVILSFDEDEKIDLFNPSPVQPVETTPAVTLESASLSAFQGLESSSDSPVEVEIVGLQNDCVGRRFGLVPALVSSVASGVASVFPGVNDVSNLASSLASTLTSALNLTLRFTTTLTATVTVKTTTTIGSKAFTVSVCTPSPFLYATCTA